MWTLRDFMFSSDSFRSSIALTTLFTAPALITALSLAPLSVEAQTSSGNLIVNGDAEISLCATAWAPLKEVPGWIVTGGSPSVLCYSTSTFSTPTTPSRGNALFSNGPFAGNGVTSTMTQTVNVTSASTAIAAGSVTFDLSAWLGGYTSLAGQAAVTAKFLNTSGTQLSSASLSPVTAANRSNTTGLLSRSSTGAVPVGTALIEVDVSFTSDPTSYNDVYVDNLSLTLSAPVNVASLVPPASLVPAFDHVFMIMLENTSYDQIFGDTKDAPYINSLFSQGATFSKYTGVIHPSDANYQAIAGGDTFAGTNYNFSGALPPTNPSYVSAINLADQVEAVGKSWKAYNQGNGATACNLVTKDPFYPDDEPLITFSDVSTNQTRCDAHVFDITQLATDLAKAATTPNFSWISANDYNNGEESGNGSAGSLQVQDAWAKTYIGEIMASPAWKTQNSLIILTWDEGYATVSDQIGTVFLASNHLVQPVTVTAAYDHYNAARVIETALGLAPMTPNDTYAGPVNEAFAPVLSAALPAAKTPATMTTATPNVAVGSSIAINYTVPSSQQSSTNWVGIYATGQSPANYSQWTYAAGANGTASFSTAALPAGNYFALLLYNNGYVPMSAPLAFTLTKASTTLTTTTASAASGSMIPVVYRTPVGQIAGTNKLGLYPSGKSPGQTTTPTLVYSAPLATGSIVLNTTGLATGTYSLYLYNTANTPLGDALQISLQ